MNDMLHNTPFPEAIAQICHEANRTFCHLIGDDSQLPWTDAPLWQRQSALFGVEKVISGQATEPKSLHESWYEVKKAQGWVYGEVKDPDKKTHPCMVPYSELPEEQRMKDDLFFAIVKAFSK